MVRGIFGLGIDYGTSNTVAMLRWPDGRVKPLLFEGSPLLPSAVFYSPDGELVVGSDAMHRARFEPARLEPNPKRRIDDAAALLGDREIPVVDMIAAALRHVAGEARRVTGGVLPRTALSHPAGWGPVRRTVLLDAARAAGFDDLVLVPEPSAAAHHLTTVSGQSPAVGQSLVVYDLGGGTFDASVVRRLPDGFEVVAVDGIDDLGGLDVDAVIVDWLRTRFGAERSEYWDRIAHPVEPHSRHQRRSLWDDARVAKEMLSRAPVVTMGVPDAGIDTQFTRDEFEALAQQLLARTIHTTTSLIRYAGFAPGGVGVLLVGGASRIPLVATLLHHATGIAPIVTEQPELVVAEGALLSVPAEAYVEPPAIRPVSPAPVSSVPVSSVPVSPAYAADVTPVSSVPVSPAYAADVTPVSSVPVSPARVSSVPVPVAGVTPIPPASEVRHVTTPRRSRSRARALSTVVAVAAVVAAIAFGGIAWALSYDPDKGGGGALPSPTGQPTPTQLPTDLQTSEPVESPVAETSSAARPTRTGNEHGGGGGSSNTAKPTCEFTMPDLTGKAVAYARETLAHAGYTNTATVTGKATSDGSLVDKVVDQKPKSGTKVRCDASITIYEGQPDEPEPASPPPSTMVSTAASP
jgi:molecular chaperone DnaK